MTWTEATRVGIPFALALIVAYDVAAYLRGGVRATISRVVLGWSRSRSWGPLIPLFVGVLLGHLFWSQPDPGLCDCACEQEVADG